MPGKLAGLVAAVLVGTSLWVASVSPAPAAEAEAGAGAEVGETHEAAEGSGSSSFLSYEEPHMRPRTSFGGLMLRLLLSMAIILGLIYGGVLVVRLLVRKSKGAPKSEKLIRVVDRAMLDPKRAIYLVKVVDRLLVIGVGTSEVRTLAEIEDETIVESIQDTEFSSHLQGLLGRLAGRQASGRP